MPNFLKKVQATLKVRSIKSKIKKHQQVGKKLSREYRNAIKTESKKLSNQLKRSKRKSKKTSSRKRR